MGISLVALPTCTYIHVCYVTVRIEQQTGKSLGTSVFTCFVATQSILFHDK